MHGYRTASANKNHALSFYENRITVNFFADKLVYPLRFTDFFASPERGIYNRGQSQLYRCTFLYPKKSPKKTKKKNKTALRDRYSPDTESKLQHMCSTAENRNMCLDFQARAAGYMLLFMETTPRIVIEWTGSSARTDRGRHSAGASCESPFSKRSPPRSVKIK